MKKEHLLLLMRSKSTVFTIKEVALIWQESDAVFVRKKLYRYVKTGKLYSVRRGIYAKDTSYDKFELATKILTPAYISFETVLMKAGVMFQFYDTIFVASYLSRELTINNQVYSFKKMKDSLLTNTAGMEMSGNYYSASPERALLDVIYLNTEYHFDNLLPIDWDKVDAIATIYGNNKRMKTLLNKYREATLC